MGEPHGLSVCPDFTARTCDVVVPAIAIGWDHFRDEITTELGGIFPEFEDYRQWVYQDAGLGLEYVGWTNGLLVAELLFRMIPGYNGLSDNLMT